MKRFITAMLLIAATCSAGESKCPTPQEMTKWMWLSQMKNLWEAAEMMDRYWSLKFKLADLTSVSDKEYQKLIKDAPRTLGDGKSYSDHYWSRAEDSEKRAKEADAKLKAFQEEIKHKYGDIAFTISDDGDVSCLSFASPGKSFEVKPK